MHEKLCFAPITVTNIPVLSIYYILNVFSRSPFSVQDVKTVDVGRSKPVNMPSTTAYPILIESGSVSSCEQSPKLLDTYQRNFEETGGAGEVQLKEDLADAMLESPGIKEAGKIFYFYYCGKYKLQSNVSQYKKYFKLQLLLQY